MPVPHVHAEFPDGTGHLFPVVPLAVEVSRPLCGDGVVHGHTSGLLLALRVFQHLDAFHDRWHRYTVVNLTDFQFDWRAALLASQVVHWLSVSAVRSLDWSAALLASQVVHWLSVSAVRSLDWSAALLASWVVHWLSLSAAHSLDWSAALLAQQASRASVDTASRARHIA